ncbi:hypothetical protein [Thauera humireducens]|uniref:hypothetical protein n=1 Tax=Thauera humireducens TaxID=1134435 RepID=UPI00311DC73C
MILIRLIASRRLISDASIRPTDAHKDGNTPQAPRRQENDDLHQDPEGQDEVAHRSRDVGQRARRLLILIDGRRGTDELAASADDAIATTLSQLEEAGLIEAVAAAAPERVACRRRSKPASRAISGGQAPKAGDLQLARDFMMNTLRTFHGPYARPR